MIPLHPSWELCASSDFGGFRYFFVVEVVRVDRLVGYDGMLGYSCETKSDNLLTKKS